MLKKHPDTPLTYSADAAVQGFVPEAVQEDGVEVHGETEVDLQGEADFALHLQGGEKAVLQGEAEVIRVTNI